MTARHCLFIDDEKDSMKSTLDGFPNTISGDSIFYECIEPQFDSNGISVANTISVINEYISKNNPIFIACDFNFGYDDIYGIDIIEQLRKKRPQCLYVLYSADRDKVCSVVKDRISQLKDDSAISLLKTLTYIESFLDRGEIESRLSALVKRGESVYFLVTNELLKYRSLKIDYGYAHFAGKNIDEVIEEIDKSTHHGSQFVKEVIERAICNLVRWNS